MFDLNYSPEDKFRRKTHESSLKFLLILRLCQDFDANLTSNLKKNIPTKLYWNIGMFKSQASVKEISNCLKENSW